MRAAAEGGVRLLVVAIVLTIALAGFANNAHSQATANGAVWVDTNGGVVGPALGNDKILLKIPSVGNIVVLVSTPVIPTTLGDPIRWKYEINTDLTPQPTLAMRFQSSDCTGQGYADLLPFNITSGNTVQVSQLYDSVNRWLIVGSFPTVVPIPHFNSQLVQGLQGPGAYCQTVNVNQNAIAIVPVTHFIDQQTLASPAMLLQ